MDIRGWPLDKIMQLPDECFGRRWAISIGGQGTDAVPLFQISEDAFPDVCVIWQVFGCASTVTNEYAVVDMRLGDHLPVIRAEFQLMEMLVPSLSTFANLRSRLILPSGVFVSINQVRMPVAAQGRRLVVEYSSVAIASIRAAVGVVVSSIPKEIPDWLSSGSHRGR